MLKTIASMTVVLFLNSQCYETRTINFFHQQLQCDSCTLQPQLETITFLGEKSEIMNIIPNLWMLLDVHNKIWHINLLYLSYMNYFESKRSLLLFSTVQGIDVHINKIIFSITNFNDSNWKYFIRTFISLWIYSQNCWFLNVSNYARGFDCYEFTTNVILPIIQTQRTFIIKFLC